MKHVFRAEPGKGIVSNNEIDTFDESLLEPLTLNMLYETFDNYPECSEEGAYQIVLEHVITYITEDDDDMEYSSIRPFADPNNRKFCQAVKNIVYDHYDEYPWLV